MPKYIKTRIDLKAIDPELAEEVIQSAKAFNELQKRVTAKIVSSDAFKTVQSLASGAIEVKVEGHAFYLNFPLSEQFDHQSRTFLGESTLNVLLTGKLLTDDQKRRLLLGYVPSDLFQDQVPDEKKTTE